jgi:Na+-driven multidrug efflux pump
MSLVWQGWFVFGLICISFLFLMMLFMILRFLYKILSNNIKKEALRRMLKKSFSIVALSLTFLFFNQLVNHGVIVFNSEKYHLIFSLVASVVVLVLGVILLYQSQKDFDEMLNKKD